MKRILTAILLFIPFLAFGQRVESVHGQATFEVTDNTRITLYEAKQEAIKMAQENAIIKVFGQNVIKDVEIVNEERNGKNYSRYREVNRSGARGKWLGNDKDPVIDIGYDNGILYINADVWGQVREYAQSQADLRWSVAVENESGQHIMTTQLYHKQPFYVHFQSSVDGYIAIYVLDQDGEASCILPKDAGIFHVVPSRKYRLFDPTDGPSATTPWFTVNEEREDYQFVLVFSPKYFNKCVDEQATNINKYNTVKAKYFESWLKRIQIEDPDVVVKQLPVAVYKEEN